MKKKAKRKPPKERIFYRAPRHWDIWKIGALLFSAPGLVLAILTAWVTIALVYLT